MLVDREKEPFMTIQKAPAVRITEQRKPIVSEVNVPLPAPVLSTDAWLIMAPLEKSHLVDDGKNGDAGDRKIPGAVTIHDVDDQLDNATCRSCGPRVIYLLSADFLMGTCGMVAESRSCLL